MSFIGWEERQVVARKVFRYGCYADSQDLPRKYHDPDITSARADLNMVSHTQPSNFAAYMDRASRHEQLEKARRAPGHLSFVEFDAVAFIATTHEVCGGVFANEKA